MSGTSGLSVFVTYQVEFEYHTWSFKSSKEKKFCWLIPWSWTTARYLNTLLGFQSLPRWPNLSADHKLSWRVIWQGTVYQNIVKAVNKLAVSELFLLFKGDIPNYFKFLRNKTNFKMNNTKILSHWYHLMLIKHIFNLKKR